MLLSRPQALVCEAEVSWLTSVFQLILATTVFSHKPLSGMKTKPRVRNKDDSIHVKQLPDPTHSTPGGPESTQNSWGPGNSWGLMTGTPVTAQDSSEL